MAKLHVAGPLRRVNDTGKVQNRKVAKLHLFMFLTKSEHPYHSDVVVDATL